MTRRRAILAALAAALLPQRLRTGNVSQTCPPPFIRTEDPLLLALRHDLRSWAQTNRHVRHATLLLHPQLSHLSPSSALFVEFDTTFHVQASPIDYAPWIILPLCGDEPGKTRTTPFQRPIHTGITQALVSPA